MTNASYPFEATSDLPGIGFGAMRQMIMMQVKSAGLTVLEDEDRHLTVETVHGLIGLRPGSETETAGYVGAVDEHWLFVMKNAVVMQMQHVMPEVANVMRWSNGPEEGSLPPNFAFVQVREVVQLGPNFLRVTFQGEDLSKHQDASIHFRLVIPPEGVAPQWPTVAANGSIVWPEGEGAPHKPVYTTRSIDHGTNTLLMDVYIHEGGRVTDWARSHMGEPGARRVVGVVGPSGGGLLHADSVLMASDETGFPAAARLLENLPEGVTGQLILEAGNGAECAYPFDVPGGIAVKWLSRSKGDVLGDEALAALPKHGSAKIWFAGERSQAKAVRDAAKAAGREAGDLRISAFWAKPTD
ncbi:MAG: siderophore-interacting protein [Pseudomonadota bacterium]